MTHAPSQGSKRIEPDTLVLWAVLALPGAVIVALGLMRVSIAYTNWTGLLAGLFFALTLFVTPVQRMLGSVPWLRGKRRYLGVASFGYATLHLAVWIAKAKPDAILHSFFRPEILLGWLALAIMIPLAVTSYDGAVRRLGPAWKTLHRWAYLAAALTIVHWLWAGEWKKTGAVIAVVLVALELWRYARHRARTAH